MRCMDSTLMTSAPRSPINTPQYGPAQISASSSERTPSRGRPVLVFPIIASNDLAMPESGDLGGVEPQHLSEHFLVVLA